MKQIDITGQKFNRLTAVKFIKKINGRHYWSFKCDCGKIMVVLKNSVIHNNTKSCGCLRNEKNKYRNVTHGMRKTKFYSTWCRIKERCLNRDSKSFKNYGNRGIKVCERWLESFENFRDDMYQSYLDHVEMFGEQNTTIDRINNNGNYCKENCKWSTREKQANNRRSSRFIKYKNKYNTIRGWEKEFNINKGILWQRLKYGWSIKRAIETPIKKLNKYKI